MIDEGSLKDPFYKVSTKKKDTSKPLLQSCKTEVGSYFEVSFGYHISS